MAIRTSATEVKAIMDNCTISDTVIETNYITPANKLVTKILGDDTDIGDVLLEQVECWFSAHMIACTRHRTAEQEKLGDATVKYTGQYGKNLESTPYGQMVLQLDFTGKMANLGKKGASIYGVTSFD